MGKNAAVRFLLVTDIFGFDALNRIERRLKNKIPRTYASFTRDNCFSILDILGTGFYSFFCLVLGGRLSMCRSSWP